MSDEEIIKELEEFIENYNASYPEEKEWVAIYPNEIQAIENLIKEYKELQVENLELLKKIETLEEEKLLLQSRFKDNGKHIPRID